MLKGINYLALAVMLLFIAGEVHAKGLEALALHEGLLAWRTFACSPEHDSGKISGDAQNSPFAAMEQTPLQLSADLGIRVKEQTAVPSGEHGQIAKRYGQLSLELGLSGSASSAEKSIP